jgi:hypothetical protein
MDEQGFEDIGYGVQIAYRSWGDHDKGGLVDEHDRPDGKGRCYGGVQFDLPGMRDDFSEDQIWQVESWEPLTISPSLLCRICGHHGWIREGRWVPA